MSEFEIKNRRIFNNVAKGYIDAESACKLLNSLIDEVNKLEEDIDFYRRDKVVIIKQLGDPENYVKLSKYRKLEKENSRLKSLPNKIIDDISNKLGKWKDCRTDKTTGYELSPKDWNKIVKKYRKNK